MIIGSAGENICPSVPNSPISADIPRTAIKITIATIKRRRKYAPVNSICPAINQAAK